MDIYSAIVIITVLLLAVTVTDIYTNRVISIKTKHNSVLVCLCIGLAIFFEWAGMRLDGADPSLIFLHKTAKLCEFCFSPVISALAAMSYSRIKRPIPVIAILAGHALFEIIALQFGLVISIDENNVYNRGSLYFVYIIIFSASIIYCVVSVIREDVRHYTKPAPVLIATLIFLAVGIGIQMVYSDIRIDYMCVAIANYLLYNHRNKMIFQLDGLTRLLNRRCYEKDIERLNSSAVFINMDVNKFKEINDTYGHTTGDYYLKSIAEIIRRNFGRYGSCYRTGGDEFCVVVTKHTDAVQQCIGSFRADIDKRRSKDVVFPAVAVGYAYFDGSNSHRQAVFEQADEMMYSVKKEIKEKENG